MDQKLPIFTKKVWNLMRVMFLMLQKGIPKRKLLLDFNMMIKRSKIAGKALQNLLFHHHHHWPASAAFAPPPGEYEFSCSNTPSNFSLFHKKRNSNHSGGDRRFDVMQLNSAVMKAAVEMMASPAPELPGFGRSPVVGRRLRVSDSPFPVDVVEDNGRVDEAAERFIWRFYDELRRENAGAAVGSS